MSLLPHEREEGGGTGWGEGGWADDGMVGVTTDVCVNSTMREGSDRGYDCLLVRGCTEAAGPGMREAAMESVMAEGGIFGTVAEMEDVLEILEGWVGGC